jgi:hypothetical protein
VEPASVVLATAMWAFESKEQRLIPRHRFLLRLSRSFAIGFSLLAIALLIGVLGYRYLAHLSWIDALLNASMILAGMGPVNELPDDAAKIFASLYAIFSGVVFISVMAIILSPAVHRLLHKFHVADEEEKD